MSTKIKDFTYLLSGIIAVGAAFANMIQIKYAPYAFALGVVGIIIIRITNLTHSENLRIRRLYKIQALGTILLLAAAYLMFINHNAWVICLLLSAVFDLIVSFRMPKE